MQLAMTLLTLLNELLVVLFCFIFNLLKSLMQMKRREETPSEGREEEGVRIEKN